MDKHQLGTMSHLQNGAINMMWYHRDWLLIIFIEDFNYNKFYQNVKSWDALSPFSPIKLISKKSLLICKKKVYWVNLIILMRHPCIKKYMKVLISKI